MSPVDLGSFIFAFLPLPSWHLFTHSFSVLAFPCNQFGGQEPGTNEEIKALAAQKYGATFPMFVKADVNGPQTQPMYKYLKQTFEKGKIHEKLCK